MRAPASLLTITAVALLPLLSAFAPACTNAASSAAPDSGTSSGSSGSSSGGGGDGGNTATGFYVPQGCEFGFDPQTTLPSGAMGFTNTALDSNTAAVSSTMGVPVRVRLGLPGGVTKGSAGYADPSTMAAFTWETAEQNQAAKVRFATSSSGVASGTVQAGYVWTVPASEGLGTGINMHEVFVCGLTPATHYYYQVGGGPSGSEVWSAVQDFMTMPAKGSNVTIGVFGDARDVVGVWESVHERMKEQAPGLMVIPGDVVDLGTSEMEYQQWLSGIWKDPNNANGFLTLGQQYIVPINGNHENDSADSFANWAIPGDSTDKYPETYASFDVGPIHFVAIDDLYVSQGATNAVAAAQLTWLKADLAAADADRSNHPFIVAYSHRGMFSTSEHAGDSDVLTTRGVLAPIYDQYKVDLVIDGHDHEYERSKPLHAGSPPNGAPVTSGITFGTTYIINAGAGADPYAINSSPQSYSAVDAQGHPVQQAFCPSGTACGSSPYIGLYAFLSATKTALTWTEYGLKASSTSIADDTVIDTVVLQAQ